MRKWAAIALAVVAPGAGLIVLRREWLGVVVSALFAVLAQVAILGMLLVPWTIPQWVTIGAVICGVLVWAGNVVLTVQRAGFCMNPRVDAELERLSAQAADCVRRGAYTEAHDLLGIARTLNDEDVALNAQWATLMTLMGRRSHARRAWRRVLQSNADPGQRRTAEQALAALVDS